MGSWLCLAAQVLTLTWAVESSGRSEAKGRANQGPLPIHYKPLQLNTHPSRDP
jgi:hypothetical protein